MLLTRNLFQELDRFNHEMDALFKGHHNRSERSDFPLTNVVEEEDHFKVYSLLAGVDPKEVEVTFEDAILTIAGEKKSDIDDKKNYLRQERAFGTFNKQLKLRVPVDVESIKAQYKNGVLEININKAPEAKPVKIEVN